MTSMYLTIIELGWILYKDKRRPNSIIVLLFIILGQDIHTDMTSISTL